MASSLVHVDHFLFDRNIYSRMFCIFPEYFSHCRDIHIYHICWVYFSCCCRQWQRSFFGTCGFWRHCCVIVSLVISHSVSIESFSVYLYFTLNVYIAYSFRKEEDYLLAIREYMFGRSWLTRYFWHLCSVIVPRWHVISQLLSSKDSPSLTWKWLSYAKTYLVSSFSQYNLEFSYGK